MPSDGPDGTVVGHEVCDKHDVPYIHIQSGVPHGGHRLMDDGVPGGFYTEDVRHLQYGVGHDVDGIDVLHLDGIADPELVARVFHEVFLYFETAIYRRFDLPVRRFLLELAPFESFDLEMARMVSGDPRAGERLDWIFRYTTMLRYDDCQCFHFWSGFRAVLRWEMEREYTEEKRKALFSRGGLYYELKEDYAHALECYTSGGDHAKISALLIRNAELHPGMGHYAEMEQYYRALPEAEILSILKKTVSESITPTPTAKTNSKTRKTLILRRRIFRCRAFLFLKNSSSLLLVFKKNSPLIAYIRPE